MKRGHTPLRSCIVCRRRAPKEKLVRWAVRQGEVVEDNQKCENSRGAYCCPDEQCRTLLQNNKKKLNKALRLHL